MKLLAPLIFIGLLLLAGFTLLNWNTLMTPADLSFFVFEVVAPLGLVLLGALVLFVALFTVYVLVLRTAMLMDAHRHAKELKAQQKLADDAEASRLGALRADVEREFARVEAAATANRADFNARLESMERSLLAAIEESSRSFAAHLGEVEDKLDRSLGLAPPAPRL